MIEMYRMLIIAGMILASALTDVHADGYWEKHVRFFNDVDTELYCNEVPNAKALMYLKENAPCFECPDVDVEQTFAFRWWTYRKHLKRVSDGWVVTEFLPQVPWSGPQNTIACPLGHHVREGRWLKNKDIVYEHLSFMLKRGNVNGSDAYVCWPAVSVCDWVEVSGNKKDAVRLLPLLENNHAAWEKSWFAGGERLRIGKDRTGLYLSTGDHEGTEISLGGYGYRPLVNAAMFGELAAMARIADWAGDSAKADKYRKLAAEFANSVRTRLWNEEKSFFTVVRPDMTRTAVRELHGYAPWYFDMPLAGYEKAWHAIADEKGFKAPVGLTFAERSAEGFAINYGGHECQWNGPTWPYATSVALTALIKYLRSPGRHVVSPKTFSDLVVQYARQHRMRLDDGRVIPWIDENLDPFTGKWLSREIILMSPAKKIAFPRERGKDYNHSTFCDLIISGICGVIPRDDGHVEIKPLAPPGWMWWKLDNLVLHDKTYTIMYDRDGGHYGEGVGLLVKKR